VSALGVRSLLAVAREAREGSAEGGPLVVAGARELVPLLAKALRAGGDEGAVLEHGPLDSALALVWIGPAEPDADALRAAARAGLALVGVSEGASLRYVLDTALVRVGPGQGLPVEGVGRALARALGPRGVSLAARLPVLRGAVVDELVESCARRNGAIGAAVFVPGADFPVLLLNELRLVLRIALAHGGEIGPGRIPDVLGVLGAGLGSRRLARGLCGAAPVVGFALRGAVAYGATRAIGAAASARFGEQRGSPSDMGPRLPSQREQGGSPDGGEVEP
jgi:uncharacterized protein (DUF697 family)